MSRASRQRRAAERRTNGEEAKAEATARAEAIVKVTGALSSKDRAVAEDIASKIDLAQWQDKADRADAKGRKWLAEATWDFWDNLIDPQDAFRDDDGEQWRPLGGTAGREGGVAALLDSESKLELLRTECRNLALTNEFAINAHENRISYIVGSGHNYTVEYKKGHEAKTPEGDEAKTEANEADLLSVQEIIDEFVEEAGWHKRQQEIRRRKDRDGECFLRFFKDADGQVSIRFVEPGDVSTPTEFATDPAYSFGIQTDPADVETVLAYYIDGKRVDASEIQHRKENVDSNVKRGLPLLYPVRKNLRRAEKLLRNMSVTAEIQAAISMLRKHGTGTGTVIEAAVQARADHAVRNVDTGQTTYHKQYGPGTILDTSQATEYEFPAHGIDASRFVLVLQAELRAIASRLVMPEFMLTSDASNANYSSTMVAEGPAVKYFERLQWDTIVDDRDVMDRVLDAAVTSGRLGQDILDKIEVHAEPPGVQTRDKLQEAQGGEILNRVGAMSARTISEQAGLDPDKEKERLAEENDEKQKRLDVYQGLADGEFNPRKPEEDDDDD